MGEVLLVSLVSDQTIPNVQLINEFGNAIDKYLFISTNAMEVKGVRNWIIGACDIPEEKILPPVVVDQFSFGDIESKLDAIPFDQYDKLIVNLTGGTKVMTLVAFDFFKDLGAEIYYLTGSQDNLIRLAPGRKKKTETLKSKVNLIQYLKSYGFDIKETEPSDIPFEYTCRFFDLYVKGVIGKYHGLLSDLRKKRRDKAFTELSSFEELRQFVGETDFPLSLPDKLTRYEVKYITGEWFEEYVAHRLMTELSLSTDELKTGIVITKKNKSGINIPNEMDVVFTWKNNIHIIECKTSVFHDVLLDDGSIKPVSIIGETLYKSDSLTKGLGLHAITNLFILDSLDEHRNTLQSHLARASLFNIKVADKQAILEATKISGLIGIHS